MIGGHAIGTRQLGDGQQNDWWVDLSSGAGFGSIVEFSTSVGAFGRQLSLAQADPVTGVDQLTATVTFTAHEAALGLNVPVAPIPAALAPRYQYWGRKSETMPDPTLVDGIPQ